MGSNQFRCQQTRHHREVGKPLTRKGAAGQSDFAFLDQTGVAPQALRKPLHLHSVARARPKPVRISECDPLCSRSITSDDF